MSPSGRIAPVRVRSAVEPGEHRRPVAVARLVHVRDPACRHARRVARRNPLGAGGVERDRLDPLLQQVDLVAAQRIGGETPVGGKRGVAERGRQPGEERVVAGGDDEEPVGGAEGRKGCDRRVARAGPVWPRPATVP
jgi:hypothetical protein